MDPLTADPLKADPLHLGLRNADPRGLEPTGLSQPQQAGSPAIIGIRTPVGEPVAEPWTARPLDSVALHLLDLAGRHLGRPSVIGVDGRSASGKSTFARRLLELLPGSAAVHSDDVAWWQSFFGWDHLMAGGVLEPARSGAEVSFRPPAWDARGRPGAITVPVGTAVIIVEGVGVTRRSLAHLLDAAVWVQCDAAEARRRGLARDAADGGTEQFWDEWDAEEVPFLAADRPWERADLVVCGTAQLCSVPYDPGTEALVGRSLRPEAHL